MGYDIDNNDRHGWGEPLNFMRLLDLYISSSLLHEQYTHILQAGMLKSDTALKLALGFEAGGQQTKQKVQQEMGKLF